MRCTKWSFLSLWSTDVVVKMKIKQNPSTLKTKTSVLHLTDPQKESTSSRPRQVNTSFVQKDTYFKDLFVFEVHIKLKYIYFNFYTLIKYLTARSATGYQMPNPFYTYILNILFLNTYRKWHF